MMTNDDYELFLEELAKLCKRHNAVMFPRKDSQHVYISIEIGGVWIDLKRIDGEAAERAF